MKIKLNPDYYGHEECDGTHCEWYLSEEKHDNIYHTFEPTESIPIRKNGGKSSLLFCMVFENWEEDLKEGKIIVVEENGIRFDTQKHKFI